MAPRTLHLCVTTMDTELEFDVVQATTGRQLFDQVVKTIGLREVWFFGLEYTSAKGINKWLKLNKKVGQHKVKKQDPLQFRFLAKFYPEDVTEELIHDVTLRLFYLQVKSAILSDEIYCPPEISLMLASYVVQVRHGDYNPSIHKTDFLPIDRLLSQRVIVQHKLSKTEWEQSIVNWWQSHRGMYHEDAMIQYLRIAQDLEMYGLKYFAIKNKKSTELWLGVDALGLHVFERDNKLTPKIGFHWADVMKISYSGKRFIIKPTGKNVNPFVFFSSSVKMNKLILHLCEGNHELYMRRRQPDTMDVQQMRAQAREDKELRRQEREMLHTALTEREHAQQKQQEYEQRLQQMQLEMEQSRIELTGAQEIIRQLEAELKKLHAAKDDLEQHKRQLQSMLQRLEEAKSMESAEKMKLEQQIRAKQSEVQHIQNVVNAKDEETKRLQAEVEEARRKQAEAAVALLAQHTAKDNVEDDGEAGFRDLGAGTNEDIKDPVEDRRTLAECNERLRDQLKTAKNDLALLRDETKQTQNDKIHTENVRHGRDKYKTLLEIRRGNTKRRVEQFENM